MPDQPVPPEQRDQSGPDDDALLERLRRVVLDADAERDRRRDAAMMAEPRVRVVWGDPARFEVWSWGGRVWVRLDPAATAATVMAFARRAADRG